MLLVVCYWMVIIGMVLYGMFMTINLSSSPVSPPPLPRRPPRPPPSSFPPCPSCWRSCSSSCCSCCCWQPTLWQQVETFSTSENQGNSNNMIIKRDKDKSTRYNDHKFGYNIVWNDTRPSDDNELWSSISAFRLAESGAGCFLEFTFTFTLTFTFLFTFTLIIFHSLSFQLLFSY